MMHDEEVVPQPPVTRALAWAKAQLRSAGCQVKLSKPYKVSQIMTNIRQAYSPATAKPVDDHTTLSGEPKQPLTEWITKDGSRELARHGTVLELRGHVELSRLSGHGGSHPDPGIGKQFKAGRVRSEGALEQGVCWAEEAVGGQFAVCGEAISRKMSSLRCWLL